MQIDIPAFSWSPYGLIVVLSVIAGFAAAVLLMRRAGVGKQTIFYTCLTAIVCTFITSLMVTFRITERGIVLSFSGLGAAVGLIGGVLIAALIIRDKPDEVMAAFIASAPLMYGLAKLGCFLAGCCHGKPYSGPFAVTYHNEHAGTYFPVQLVDMAAFILIHILAVFLITKMKNKFSSICIILSVLIPVRFALEYLKYYHDGSPVSSGQITVLIAGAIAVILVLVWKKILKINYR